MQNIALEDKQAKNGIVHCGEPVAAIEMIYESEFFPGTYGAGFGIQATRACGAQVVTYLAVHRHQAAVGDTAAGSLFLPSA